MLLVICGRSGCGKTTVAREMQRHGYVAVSASQIAAQMFVSEYGYEPTRRDLAEFGTQILTSSREEEYMFRVLNNVLGVDKVVVEGLRSIRTVECLQVNYSAVVVLMTRSIVMPQSGVGSIDEVDIELHQIVSEVDSYLDTLDFRPDIIVDNDESVRETCSTIFHRVNEVVCRR